MTQEEQLLDELLLDENTPGSIDNTIKVFPDETRLDENKTSGRKHRSLLKSILARLKAWVKAELLGKADLINGKVDPEQLPAVGTTTVTASQTNGYIVVDGGQVQVWDPNKHEYKIPYFTNKTYHPGELFSFGNYIFETVSSFTGNNDGTGYGAILAAGQIRLAWEINATAKVDASTASATRNQNVHDGNQIDFVIGTGFTGTVFLTAANRMPLGARFTITAKMLGATGGVAFHASSIPVDGDVAMPAFVAGDVVVYELLCRELGRLQLTRKYIAGKQAAADSGGGSPLVLSQRTSLLFDNLRGYQFSGWQISAPTAYTKNATGYLPFVKLEGTIIADGINKPTFSADFVLEWENYKNDAGQHHHFLARSMPNGKILYSLSYV